MSPAGSNRVVCTATPHHCRHTAILDREHPDSAAIAKLKADANRTLVEGVTGVALAEFYYER
jgi:hypothetical protein